MPEEPVEDDAFTFFQPKKQSQHILPSEKLVNLSALSRKKVPRIDLSKLTLSKNSIKNSHLMDDSADVNMSGIDSVDHSGVISIKKFLLNESSDQMKTQECTPVCIKGKSKFFKKASRKVENFGKISKIA